MFNCARRFVLMGGLALLTLSMSGNAQSPSEKRTALRGFDPVSYFDPGQPGMGWKEINAAFDDSVYQFKSWEHRATFIADPERYAPQYNAYCAGSMSRGRKIEADPNLWAIHDGKLYVFSSEKALAAFLADANAMIEQANVKWPALIKAPLSPPRR